MQNTFYILSFCAFMLLYKWETCILTFFKSFNIQSCKQRQKFLCLLGIMLAWIPIMDKQCFMLPGDSQKTEKKNSLELHPIPRTSLISTSLNIPSKTKTNSDKCFSFICISFERIKHGGQRNVPECFFIFIKNKYHYEAAFMPSWYGDMQKIDNQKGIGFV